jgi:hypothetical protein
MNFLKTNIAIIKKNIKFDFKDKIKNYKFFEKKLKFEPTLSWTWQSSKFKVLGLCS